jgi:hypothetical protein
MTEFKFVQWGKGTPVDYQRLNAMMLNEQYLKDVVDNTPKGVLAWKSVTGSTYSNPTGSTQDVTNLSNIVFDVQKDRMISFEVQSGRLYSPTTTVELRFSLSIDGVNTGDISGTVVYGTTYQSPVVYTWMPSEALSQGTHTVSAQFVSNNAPTSIQIGQSSRCSLIVRDEGSFISASS